MFHVAIDGSDNDVIIIEENSVVVVINDESNSEDIHMVPDEDENCGNGERYAANSTEGNAYANRYNFAEDLTNGNISTDQNTQEIVNDESVGECSQTKKKYISSTLLSLPSFSGSFDPIDLSNISVNLEISTGTRETIEMELRQANENLNALNAVLRASGAQSDNDPGSPGSMNPNMSIPEMMLATSERELIRIHHTA